MSFGDLFLATDTSRLLATAEPWGDEARDIHLPFGACRLLQLTAEQYRALDGLDRGHQLENMPGLEIRAWKTQAQAFNSIDWRNKEYDLEFDYETDGVLLAGDGFLARLDLGDVVACQLWTRINDPELFAGVAQNLLRVVTAYCLLQRKGVLLHSSGIGVDESAIVFFGRSGAGKSTVAASALEQGHDVFSDDLNAVIPVESGYAVAAVPFTGDLRHSTVNGGRLPLTAIYQLRQSGRNATERLSVPEAVARLAACSPFVNVDPHRQAALLDALTSLVTSVPTGELFFRKPVDFWGEVI
jgi:hypothetical protein